MKKIFILAGEPSGDMHGARLMKAIIELDPNVEFMGIGGAKMKELCLESILPISEMSVVGMWEVAKKINFFRSALKICKDAINSEKPDVFVPIDYPGFNIRLSSYVRQSGIPVIYYIAPQLWAWGKERVKKIKGNVDLLLTVLPFEEDFFRKSGIKTSFVGHPLLDDDYYLQEFPSFEQRDKVISIFPGSRPQEIIRHEKLIREIAKEIKNKIPGYDLVIAKSNNLDDNYFNELRNVALISNDSKGLMKTSKAGIVKTGTTNLEAALCGLAGNMFYKTSWLSYSIGKRLVKVDYLSLTNILLQKPVLKEFIQSEARADKIVDDIKDIILNSERYNSIADDYKRVRLLLGGGGASRKAANIIMDYIND